MNCIFGNGSNKKFYICIYFTTMQRKLGGGGIDNGVNDAIQKSD